MFGLSLSLSPGSFAPIVGGSPFASDALALDFKNGAYWQGGTQYGSLSAVPGYAYSRTGAKAEPTTTGVSSPFAANVPAIVSGLGYYSERAFTNNLLQSQSFQTSWVLGGSQSITADTTVAPDGTTTADSFNATGGAAAYIDQFYGTATGAVVVSVYAKAGTQTVLQICDDNGGNASFCNFDLANGLVGSSNQLTGSIQAVGGGWYRCCAAYTSTGTSSTCYLVIVPSATSARAAAPSAGTLYIWQAQSVVDTVPGPPILTTTATAAAAADSLSVTVPNGSYTATYTFSDNSTQTIATTISGNTFTLPLYPATLNKLPISLVTLV